MKPYSKECRGEVRAACDRGRSTREVATYFNVGESVVRRVKQERRERNKVAPWLTRHRLPRWVPLSDRIRKLIRHQPDLTLRELKAELKPICQFRRCASHCGGFACPSKKVLIATERERPDVAERREELKRDQPLLNPDRLVFIDETWAKTNMTRPRGRC